MKKATTAESNKGLIAELVFLLNKGNAHAGFEDAVHDMKEDLLGKKPHGVPYSLWQLVEHVRITQADILEFCVNPAYKEMNWPDDYWPKEAAPANMKAFHDTVKQVEKDRKAFIELLESEEADLYEPLAHGTGQNLLREALLIADHTAYHTGEIILLRRMLGDWKA
ncbi:DinB family protein [Deminuibacter soli]|uniref:DinB family protein n=1 Tax=Deminuibacter soli TaxID=2291815 RepID=A0A3E1NJZ0_9BACT|nr:DinB family protein [Deminuibacter soli]RFM28242.1 DinB family protein [Deminuibacter soli]